LRQFEDAHAKLLKAIADLETLTRGSVPTKTQVIEARWSISRASLARRKLWHLTYRNLLSAASDLAKRELQRLYESDMAMLRSSSDHIAQWTIAEVMGDWPGYCAASKAIRWKMKAAIGGEKRILYPILENSDI
jgi:hypothetical protein